jgi:hypothetical protein
MTIALAGKSLAMLMTKEQRVLVKARTQGRAERRLARSLQACFIDQAKVLADRYRRGRGRAFRTTAFKAELLRALKPALTETALLGAVAEWELHLPRDRRGAGVPLPGGTPRGKALPGPLSSLAVRIPKSVQDKISEHLEDVFARDWWDDLADGVADDLEEIIEDGLADGLSSDEIADQIEEKLGEGNKARAETIARTEVTSALGAGDQAAKEELQKMGLIEGKEWVVVGGDAPDADVREDHVEANGQIVAVDEPFVVCGEEAHFPGDPDLSAGCRCGCRCVSLSRMRSDEDIAGEEGEKAAKFVGAKGDAVEVRQRKPWECGPASLVGAARGFGIVTTQEEAARLTGATEEAGANPTAMLSAAMQLGLAATWEIGMTLNRLASLTYGGAVILTPIQSPDTPPDEWKGGHWVAVNAVRDGQVWIMDPALGLGAPLPLDDFYRRWHDQDSEGQRYEQGGLIISGIFPGAGKAWPGKSQPKVKLSQDQLDVVDETADILLWLVDPAHLEMLKEPCRDDLGRFAPCGSGGSTAAERNKESEQRIQRARDLVNIAKLGGLTPYGQQTVMDHLLAMTARELRQIKMEHNIKLPGSSGLAKQKLAERLHAYLAGEDGTGSQRHLPVNLDNLAAWRKSGNLNVLDENTSTVRHIMQELSRIPPYIHEAVMADGFKGFFVGDRPMTALDDMQDYKGMVPRGWEGSGKTWDDVAGSGPAGRDYKDVATAGRGEGYSESNSVALHEYGHVVGLHLNLDDHPETIALHRELYGSLNPYLQQDGPGGKAGRQEFVAELFANRMVSRRRAVGMFGEKAVGFLERELKL